jgi:glycerol uptake facilitator protein
MSPFIAELIGTMLLILLGGGVVANVVLKDTKGHNSGWIVITTGWALGVFVGVLVAGPYSGAHLSPAVTLGLAIAGKFPWESVPGYIIAQFIGAMSGAFLVWAMHKDHFDRTQDPGAQLAVFATEPAIRNPLSNLFSEILGTFVLIMCVFYITPAEIVTDQKIVGLGTVGAIPIAFVVWAIGLSLGGTTGYAINPARDLGPRIMHAILPMKGKGSSGWGYAPIPVIGPIIGSSLAALLYMVLSAAK